MVNGDDSLALPVKRAARLFSFVCGAVFGFFKPNLKRSSFILVINASIVLRYRNTGMSIASTSC